MSETVDVNIEEEDVVEVKIEVDENSAQAAADAAAAASAAAAAATSALSAIEDIVSSWEVEGQDNKWQRILVPVTGELTTPNIVAAINAMPFTTVASTRIPTFLIVRILPGGAIEPRYYRVVLNGKGKGTYGAGGSVVVVESDIDMLSFIEPTYSMVADGADIITALGEIGDVDIWDALVAADPAIEVQDQDAGPTIFEVTRGGQTYNYWFLGPGGAYGVGQANDPAANIFKLLGSELVVPVQSGVKLLRKSGESQYFSPETATPAGRGSALQAAKNAALSGDLIIVPLGEYDTHDLAKDGVKYFFLPGAVVKPSASSGETKIIFTDVDLTTTVSSPITCEVYGFGEFDASDETLWGAVGQFDVGSRISLQGKSVKGSVLLYGQYDIELDSIEYSLYPIWFAGTGSVKALSINASVVVAGGGVNLSANEIVGAVQDEATLQISNTNVAESKPSVIRANRVVNSFEGELNRAVAVNVGFGVYTPPSAHIYANEILGGDGTSAIIWGANIGFSLTIHNALIRPGADGSHYHVHEFDGSLIFDNCYDAETLAWELNGTVADGGTVRYVQQTGGPGSVTVAKSSVAPGTPLTGTTSEGILQSFEFEEGLFAAGDHMSIITSVNKTGTVGGSSLKFYLSSTNSFGTAHLVAQTPVVTASSRSYTMIRESFQFLPDNKLAYPLNGTSAALENVSSTNVRGEITLDPSQKIYGWIVGQNASALDTLNNAGFLITKYRG